MLNSTARVLYERIRPVNSFHERIVVRQRAHPFRTSANLFDLSSVELVVVTVTATSSGSTLSFQVVSVAAHVRRERRWSAKGKEGKKVKRGEKEENLPRRRILLAHTTGRIDLLYLPRTKVWVKRSESREEAFDFRLCDLQSSEKQGQLSVFTTIWSQSSTLTASQ